MQVIKRLHNAGGVEAGGAIVKVASVPQYRPQLTAQAALHQHVEVFAILERLEQFHYEVRVCLEEDKRCVNLDGDGQRAEHLKRDVKCQILYAEEYKMGRTAQNA